MKKSIVFTCLLIAALVAGKGSARADSEVTFDFAKEGSETELTETTFSKGSVSIVFNMNEAKLKLVYGNNHIWMYGISSSSKKGSTMTITSDYTITKVVITFIDNNNLVSNSSYFDSGDYSLSGTVGTWAGSTKSLVLENKNTANTNSIIKIKEVVVTLQDTRTVTLSSVCTDGSKYYGTYSCGDAFVVPSDLTVSEITVANGKLQVSDYATGAVVPANTGVMVSSSTAGSHTVAPSGQTGTSLLGDNNMLKPSGDSGITSEAMAAGNSGRLYYRLTMHNGTQIGYWWGADDGVAFSIGSNKAYLAVPSSAGARQGFTFPDNETLSVGTIAESGAATATDGRAYNLQGQRVDNLRKAGGIYIVNGKKIIK